MADFSTLKAYIASYVKQNGVGAITGEILQDVLVEMVEAIGDEALNSLASALGDEITNRQNAVAGEAETRGNADTALQNAINAINTKLSEGYVYAGIATTATNPGTPTGKVFYFALAAGKYTYFVDSGAASIILTQGISILKYNGTAWSSEQLTAIDDAPTDGSSALVKSGGVFTAIAGVLSKVTDGYLYRGIATTSTNPPAPETKVFYIATAAGTYTNFGGTVLTQGINILKFNGSAWSGEQIVGFDDNPTASSHNLVKSGGVAKYKAYMANNGYGMDNTLTMTVVANDFFLPESIEFHEGDKLILELNDIEISAEDGGALVFVPWKSDDTTANEYQMRYNYGDDTPMIAVWTILSDVSIKGLHISKNSKVTAYTAKVRFAGNYAANIYECINGVNANQENISVLQSVNSNNRNGVDVVATLGIESASETNPHFTFSKPVNFKQGDKILFEVTSADIVGSSGAAIVPILENADGVIADYQLRVNIGAGTPIVIVWNVLQDIAVTGVTIIKNSSVTSYTASFRMAGNNGANIYLNAKAMADLLEYENVVIATRNVADYNSIRELVASLPATPTNKYLVYVPKGRWFECDLNGRKYVKIVGEDRDGTVLYCDGTSSNVTPADYSFGTYANMALSSVNRSYKHCIRVMDNIDIENLTVEVNDAKYCIHVDASGQRKGHFSHLKLIADANVNFPVGMGVHANQEFEFDGCEILQYTGTGGLSYTVYVHNMNNQSAICKTVFRNCYFNKKFADFGEMGSEYSALIDFINCYSSKSNPVFHFGVESVDGHSYWVNPATGQTVTDLTLVPYSIKLNYIGTNAYGLVQDNRPDILNYVIGENRIIRQ